MEKSLAERGLDAAQAFVEREGMTTLDREVKVGRTNISLVAIDGNDLVIFDIRVRKARGGAPEELTKARITTLMSAARKYADERRMSPEINLRIDGITMMVVGDDRALLRHHRALSFEEPEAEQEG